MAEETQLHIAIKCKDYYNAIQLVESEIYVNAQNAKGETALHLAADDHAREVVQALVNRGADASLGTSEGETPLHYALTFCSKPDVQVLEIIRLLLLAGVNVNARSIGGVTALHMACAASREDIVRILLDHAAEVNVEDRQRCTPLFNAVNQGDIVIMRMLLEKGAYRSVNSQNLRGETVLHKAVTFKKTEMVQVLLEAGANATICTLDGATTLHSLIRSCWNSGQPTVEHMSEIARLLLQGGVDVHAQTNNGETAMHLCGPTFHEDILHILLEHGASVNAKDERLRTPLYNAVINRNVDMVRTLLERGADPNTADENDNTALLMAFGIRCQYDVVELLLEHNANVNYVFTRDGSTPLHVAVFKGDHCLVKMLLDKGADPNVVEMTGNTALLVASERGLDNIVELLLAHNANVNCAQAVGGRTSLYNATRNGYQEIVTMLLKAGANAHAWYRGSITPALLAHERATDYAFYPYRHGRGDNVSVFMCFLKHAKDVDVNKPGQHTGNTVLHRVCGLGNASRIDELLKLGAKLEIRNIAGLTPIDCLPQPMRIEIDKMKDSRVNGRRTLYDLLVDNKKMLVLARNEDLTRRLDSEDFQNTFPTFAGVIRYWFKRAVIRRELLEQAHDTLTVVSGMRIPENCSDMIFEIISEEQLRLFASIAAFK